MTSNAFPIDEQPGWTLALLPADAWRLIDLLRWASNRPTRSEVAENVLRRALALDAEAVAR